MTIEQELQQAKDELSFYKDNGPRGLYYELNRLVNETIALSRCKSLATLVSLDPKEDKTFERMQVLIKAAKEHVDTILELKGKLNLSGDEEKDKAAVPFIEQVAEKRY